MSITLNISFDQLPDGSLEVQVGTNDFKPHEQSDAVGRLWVGMCIRINEYLRANGFPQFDCLVELDSPQSAPSNDKRKLI